MKKPVVSAFDRVPVFGVLYGYPVIMSSTTFTRMHSTSVLVNPSCLVTGTFFGWVGVIFLVVKFYPRLQT